MEPLILGVVEILGATQDVQDPVAAFRECEDELSPKFFDRLMARPEHLVLLQCDCRLKKCDGSNCACSAMEPLYKSEDSLWEKPKSKSNFEAFTKMFCFTSEAQEGQALVSAPAQEGEEVIRVAMAQKTKCSCDGLPRVSVDLLSWFRSLNEDRLTTSLREELETKEWRARSFSDVWTLDEAFGMLSSWAFPTSAVGTPYHKTLSSFNSLIDSYYSDDRALELSAKLLSIQIANQIVLNIAQSRTLGILECYLPTSSAAKKRYRCSANPLKKFLAELSDIKGLLNEESETLALESFCIEIMNQVSNRLIYWLRRDACPDIETLGEALILASLLNGFVNCKNSRNGGDGGAFELEGKHLQNFKNRVIGLRSERDTPIDPKGIYQIRGGVVVSKSDQQEIVFEKGYAIFSQGRPHVIPDRTFSELFLDSALLKTLNLRKRPPPVASDQPEYYVERMQDSYVFNEPRSKGWKNLLIRQHPYLRQVIERPGHLYHLASESPQIPTGEYCLAPKLEVLKEAKRIFDRLTDNHEMIGQRQKISSSFIEMF